MLKAKSMTYDIKWCTTILTLENGETVEVPEHMINNMYFESCRVLNDLNRKYQAEIERLRQINKELIEKENES